MVKTRRSRSKFDVYTNEELIKLIQDKSNEIGKVLAERDLQKLQLPSVKFLKRRFNCDKWTEVLLVCGLKAKKTMCNYTKEELILIIKK